MFNCNYNCTCSSGSERFQLNTDVCCCCLSNGVSWSKLDYTSFHIVKNEVADQTARMLSLVCAFVVRMQQSGFLSSLHVLCIHVHWMIYAHNVFLLSSWLNCALIIKWEQVFVPTLSHPRAIPSVLSLHSPTLKHIACLYNTKLLLSHDCTMNIENDLRPRAQNYIASLKVRVLLFQHNIF